MQSKHGMNTRWCKTEIDEDGPRKRFRRALMRLARKNRTMLTPYWKSDFIDFLLYEGTLNPCGARVESITPDVVTFEANCSGVQTEGICLDVTFEIPTSKFTRAQLKSMVHDFEYSPAHEVPFPEPIGNPVFKTCLSYEPFDPEYITECEWWYDQSYDEGVSE